MSDFRGLYNIRASKPEDANFIHATFLRGVYYGNPFFNLVPKDTFFKNYKPISEAIIKGQNNAIFVACLPDDPDTIIGYSVVSQDLTNLVWVYVKKQWRGHGIARTLIPPSITSVSNIVVNDDIDLRNASILKKYPNIIFNPFKP